VRRAQETLDCHEAMDPSELDREPGPTEHRPDPSVAEARVSAGDPSEVVDHPPLISPGARDSTVRSVVRHRPIEAGPSGGTDGRDAVE
jgi:hypothetical protein